MGFFDAINGFFFGPSAAKVPAEKYAQAVMAGISQREDAQQLIEALQVRLANRSLKGGPSTMNAQQAVDTLADANPNQRLSYQITPFSRMTTGSGTVAIACDASGEEYILLGKKENGSKWGGAPQAI